MPVSKRNPEERPTESFVERTATDESTGRPKRLSLRLNDDGSFDWSSINDATKAKLVAAVSSDPNVLELIGGGEEGGEVEAAPFTVTEEHVKRFLEMYAWAEGKIIPKIVERKSRGLVKITPEIADEVFQFTEEQKTSMAPDGAEWANETMPEWFRKFLFENVGPGMRFFGALGAISYMHMKTAIKRTIQEHPIQAEAVPAGTGQA